MGQSDSPCLIDILRKTLERLEGGEGFNRTDPAYLELTRRIARLLAELELAKQDRNTAA